MHTGKWKLGTWSHLFLGLLLLCRKKRISFVPPDCPNHCTGSFFSSFLSSGLSDASSLSMQSDSGSTANTDGGLAEDWGFMFTCFQVKGGLEVGDATLGGYDYWVNSPVLSCPTEDRWHCEQLCEQSHTFLKGSVNLASMFLLQKELLLMNYTQWLDSLQNPMPLACVCNLFRGLGHRGINILNHKEVNV